MRRDLGVGLCIVTLVLLSVAVGCTDGGPPVEVPSPRELPVPDPDLSDMEPTLQRWLGDVRSSLIDLVATEGSDVREVGAKFGELGQLYQIFDLSDAAQVCYDDARRLLPDEFRWTYLLGTVYIEKGSPEEARGTLERALEIDPDYTAAWIRLGDTLLDLNEPEAAKAAFDRATELGGESAAARFGLGRAHAALGDDAAAARDLRRALELQPEASAMRYPLAQALRRLGGTEAAEAELAVLGNRRVRIEDPIIEQLSDVKTVSALRVLISMAADPDRVSAPQLLGFALTHLGKVHGTAEQLVKVTDELAQSSEPRASELGRLHYVLAGLLVNEGRDSEAIEHFRRALDYDDGLVDARVKLGNALARNGDLAAAEAEFDRALGQDPSNRDLRMKQTTVLLNRGRVKEAMQELDALIREDPQDPVARIRRAEVLEAAGSPERAAAAYDEALGAELPATAQARIYHARGAFHRRQGRFEAAMEDFRRALELDRELQSARLDLAAVLGHLGRYQDAAGQYAQVSAARPSSERAWLGEAAALILAGDYAAACRRLDVAAHELPGSPWVALQLARLLAAAPEASVRDGDRAIELATKAARATKSTQASETLAMAYAETGRFDEAAQWQSRAAGQADQQATERLALYRSREPYRAEEPESLLVIPGR